MNILDNELNPKYEILNLLKNKSIKLLSLDELNQLVSELRNKTIEVVSKVGGHLGAGLGVIELTIALHYVFDTPRDQLIWDIGHQTYPHKIITDRIDKIETIRSGGGLSGFTKRSESIFDPWGAGHSSTSISAALGMVAARDLKGKDKEVIAIIGDGAISAGMAYEALNNCLDKNLILILNDNNMSISEPAGAISKYFLKLQNEDKDEISNTSNIFQELGFEYKGPLDGHNLEDLIKIFQDIKSNKERNTPILVHLITEKGRGFKSEKDCNEKYHSVSKFNINTGIQNNIKPINKTYTQIFSETLVDAAKQDENIIAITAAMPSGTGLNLFKEKFPDRFFDVGIAEQHAVTFAAGLACDGMKPFVAIYSTFLQRAYDQIIHDVAIQKLPVRFAIDRAGLVGADGPTHAGSFDIAFLSIIPNFVIMAPCDQNELRDMIKLSLDINDAPSAIRYPRGESKDLKLSKSEIVIGKGRLVREGNKIAVLSLGTRLSEVLIASELLKNEVGLDITIADMRFAKPIDYDLIKRLVDSHQYILVIEEGSIGGFGSQILTYLANNDLLSNGQKFRSMFLPDYFIEHNNIEEMYKEAHLDALNIKNTILNFIK